MIARLLLTIVLAVGTALAVDAQEKKAADAKDTLPSLKPNASREEVAAYLKALRPAITDLKLAFNRMEIPDQLSETPALKKLNDIPAEHLDLLILETRTFARTRFLGSPHRAYLHVLRKKELSEAQKRAVIESIGDLPELLDIVIKKGWLTDAQETVVKFAKTTADTTIPNYIPALVRIDTPEAHELTAQLLLRSSVDTMAKSYRNLYASEAEEGIRRLGPNEFPWLDINTIVAKGWGLALKQQNEATFTYATIAACYGHKDALVLLAKKLILAPERLSPDELKRRDKFGKTLSRLVPTKESTAEELAGYIFANRDKLVFDSATGTYRLP
ncbi:MAG: hypothetical protein QM790_05845 [Nibricoccus sp.]